MVHVHAGKLLCRYRQHIMDVCAHPPKSWQVLAIVVGVNDGVPWMGMWQRVAMVGPVVQTLST